MPFLEWIPAYEIGSPEIDAEHRHLVDVANRLHDAATAGESPDTLGPALRDLVDYVRSHFAREEALAKARAPEEFPGQHASHRAIVKKLKDVLCLSGTDGARASTELCALVKAWLLKHVLSVDKRLAEHLRKQAGGAGHRAA